MNFKNTVIFGDSYSTFEGFIPEGYASHYFSVPKNETDVTRVEETWWHQLMKETDSNLILNNSWSGSTVCYTAYGGRDCSGDSSFIYRFEKLVREGFFEKNKIDTLFVFGTTNDSWCGAELGALNFGEIHREELYSVLPAICYFFEKIKSSLNNTDVIVIINTELKDEISDGLSEAAKHFGFKTVKLSDIDKISGHPTVLGMKQIKEQILKSL
ncbi:MAG: SGNH/GDSL hydrolase family protein [Acutalibacteraceae bacterium]|nr:SGNH/GDSL hydrolase family protein [Acutalibacteraceae bacterium]